MNDYRLGHQAPAEDGYSAPLSAALTRFGPDVLDRPDLYGAWDEETIRQMRAAVEDPDALVRVYRAVPPEHLGINRGDWVTLSRAYAHQHGHLDGSTDWPVVFADVPAGEVWTDGNDPSEYGYDGPDLHDLAPYFEGEPMPPPGSGPAAAVDIEEAGFIPSPGARAERRQPPAPAPAPAVSPRPGRPR